MKKAKRTVKKAKRTKKPDDIIRHEIGGCLVEAGMVLAGPGEGYGHGGGLQVTVYGAPRDVIVLSHQVVAACFAEATKKLMKLMERYGQP